MFAAVLDTSVLWPSLQRDFLLSLAAEGSYRPLWSAAILEELVVHEARKLESHGEQEQRAMTLAQNLIGQMSRAFDAALVTGWESLEGTFGLPDPDDEHVLAAAVIGGAEVIVTSNLKDFPAGQIPEPIRTIPPQEFVFNTVRQHLALACRAVLEICARSGRRGPALTPDDVLETLADRYGMTDTAELLGTAPGLRSTGR